MNEINNRGKDFYVVSVKDELTGEFLQPTFGEDIESLKRIFKTQINTIPIWRENPSDFSFYLLGYFNQETGTLTPHIEKIASGHSVIERSKE